MIWLCFGALTAAYLLLWPFSLRVEGRLSPTSGRGEVIVASLVHLRLEGDFLQPPFLALYRLDGRGRRKRLKRGRDRGSSFRPVLRGERVCASLYLGVAGDGAATVELLGLLYALLTALGEAAFRRVDLRSMACFDKDICALQLSGIGRFVLAQNILEYLKGRKQNAIR